MNPPLLATYRSAADTILEGRLKRPARRGDTSSTPFPAVELFTIQCTTCKARLVVKDESVIGDILSCPKCHSMVQVVPPVGWQGAGAAESAPGELPRVAATAAERKSPSAEKPAARKTEVPREKKTVAAAAAVPPALPPKAKTSATHPALPASASRIAPSTAATTTGAAATGAATTAPAAVDEPAPASPGASMAGVFGGVRRDWIVLGGSLLGGVALGAAVWLVVAMRSDVPVEVAAASIEETTPVEPESPAPKAAPSAAASAARTSAAEQPPVEAPPSADDAELLATATPPATSREAPRADTPATDEPLVETPAAAAVDKPAEELDPATDDESTRPTPALRLDPIRPRTAGTPVDPSSILSSASDPTSPVIEPRAPARGASNVAPAAAPGGSALLSREQINSRLGVSLSSVEFADVPLAQFTAFIAGVAGVPVTFDAAVVRGRQAPIKIRLKATTAGEALRTAVERSGLSMSVEDGRIVITSGS